SKMPLNVYRRMKKLAPSEPGKNTRGAVSYGLKFFHRIRIPYAQCTDGGEPEMSFHIMPVSEPDELKTDPAGGLKLKTIDTKKDFRTLVDLVEGKNEIRLTRDQFDTYNYTVLNRCRWSNQTCDACAFHKLIIGEDDSLFTCYRSRPIGKVGDSFEALKANVDAIAQETRRRRGCADCPVKDNCAQCLFLPDYLDDADYCTIMKENREITFKMDIPSVVLQLKAQLGEQLENTEEIRISWPAPTVMDTILQEQNFQPVFGVEINGMSLLFNAGKRIFSSLSGTMSQIWKRLISGESDREILCRQLADERNISLKAITNSFNMLVGKIREISQ
ncbi:MAG: hypothetical protein GY765_28770, partial [bacterium]|nr:hypothetical protein [bacterium]